MQKSRRKMEGLILRELRDESQAGRKRHVLSGCAANVVCSDAVAQLDYAPAESVPPTPKGRNPIPINYLPPGPHVKDHVET